MEVESAQDISFCQASAVTLSAGLLSAGLGQIDSAMICNETPDRNGGGMKIVLKTCDGQRGKLLDVIAKLQQKVTGLEAVYLRKELEMDELLIAKSKLEKERKELELRRLAQLEKLAIQNLEIQKKISLLQTSTAHP